MCEHAHRSPAAAARCERRALDRLARIRACVWCGERVEGERRTRRYCGVRCRVQAWRARRVAQLAAGAGDSVTGGSAGPAATRVR